MRIAIVGASELGATVAARLLERNHEVIVVEKDREVIDELSDSLACSFLHGDGSRPGILEELGPSETDVLMCLTKEDLVNILAAVTGCSLGFDRVVTKIEDAEYVEVCTKLNLGHTIVPNETISRYLADMVEGQDILELSTIVKGDARFYSFIASKDEAGKRVSELDLPDNARVICIYREDAFSLAGEETTLREGDEAVILTDRSNIEQLRERWQPRSGGEAGGSGDGD